MVEMLNLVEKNHRSPGVSDPFACGATSYGSKVPVLFLFLPYWKLATISW